MGERGLSRTLSLQDAARWIPLQIVNDGEFETLGFLSDPALRMLTFAEHPKYLAEAARTSQVTAVLTTPELALDFTGSLGIALTANPRHDFYRFHNLLADESTFYGEQCPSSIDESARIHSSATVAPRGVCIGPGVEIEANASVGPGCTLSRGVIVGAGAVLGAMGFQTCRTDDGYLEMRHTGSLFIDEDVRIFANATIAVGLFHRQTRIGRESRIGNNAFVSHNVEIGTRTFVGHGAVVNGHVRVGREVWIGPGAVVTNNVCIGDLSRISLGSVVVSSVAPGEHVSGNFAVPHRRLLRQVAGMK